MAQVANALPTARAPRRRRWRVVLIVVLLAAADAGWWWFTRPKAMQLVDVMTPAVPGMPAGQMEVRAYPEYFAVVSRQDARVTAGSTTHIFFISAAPSRCVAGTARSCGRRTSHCRHSPGDVLR